MRRPSTSTRRAVPEAARRACTPWALSPRSYRRSRLTRPLAVELARHEVAQRRRRGGDRKGRQDLVEEARHHQPLGDPRGNAAALEVEPLVLVDRADGRRVAATYVVVLDLEIGDRLCPR